MHQYSTVGAYSFVAGPLGVRRDVPPFMIVDGNPAEVRGINRVGLERHGFTEEHIQAVKDVHRSLYRQNGAPFSVKLRQLRIRYATVRRSSSCATPCRPRPPAATAAR